MARDEQHREDLWAEATALVARVELALDGRAEPLVAGFRRDGGLSLFFGHDPVWHFNGQGELRRGYVGGALYKAEQGRLVRLVRQRGADEVQLLRHELDATETALLVGELIGRMSTLADALSHRRFQTLRQMPADDDVVGRLRAAVADLSQGIAIARSPRAG